MRKAQLAVAVGVALLLLGFAAGTWEPSASLDRGTPFSCHPAIDLSRMPFNELGDGPFTSPPTRSVRAQREESACQQVTLPTRALTWSALAVGALAVLCGWTVLRERGGADVSGLSAAGPDRRSGGT